MACSYTFIRKHNYKSLNSSLRTFSLSSLLSSPSVSSSSSSSPTLKPFSGPRRLPLIGNALDLAGLNKLLGYMEKCYSQYGDVFSVGIGRDNVIICGNADLAEYILSCHNNNNGKNYINRPSYAAIDDISHIMVPEFPNNTTGIAFANGERHWYLPRKAASGTLLQKSFLENNLHKINCHMNEHINDIKSNAINNNNINININNNNNNSIIYNATKHIPNLLMDVIGDLAFAFDFKLKKGNEVEIAGRVCEEFRSINYFIAQPIPYWRYIPSRKFKHFIENSRKINEFFMPHVDKSLEKIKHHDSSKDNTFLEILSRGHYDYGLTKPEIIASALQILAAGSDTTVNAVMFSLYLLSKYPQYQNIIYDEIKNIDLNNYDSINSSAFTTAFIKEVLRLYPPAFVFLRQAVKDDQWNGYKILSTDHIWLSPYLLGRNKKYWGESVLDFNPNRFLENRRGNINNPFAWIPFGFGVRQCVGFRISLLEIKLTLVHLVKHFTWTLDPKSVDMKATAQLITKPDRDIILHFQKRN